MITWTLIKSEAGDGHYQAEPGRNWRLSVGPLPVEGATRPSQDVRWCIQERSAATGKFIDAEDGDCSSFEDGQAAAEDAYRRLQRPIGRPLKGKRPTTSTERSKQRMDRLTATEEAAAEQRQQLAKFREDLAAAGLDDYADSVAMISGFTAIKAVAKYTRRNSFSFVTNGPQMPGGEERAQRQQKITAQADAMDMLAARLIREPIEYQSFQNILDELHGIGFRPDDSLVSYVAGALVPVSEPSPLTRAERLRRVVILCCNFTRNLAYYHAGQREKALLCPSHPQAAFWRQANANALDICVLEWCKLFGETTGAHYWGNIVSDPASFETRLLKHLGITALSFQGEVDAMRAYRNKFVAHLDSLRVMDIPLLDVARAAVLFYHQHIVEREAKRGDLTGLADNADALSKGYDQCVVEANTVFLKAG